MWPLFLFSCYYINNCIIPQVGALWQSKDLFILVDLEWELITKSRITLHWVSEEEKMAAKKDPRLTRAGVSGYNKPKRTPSHPTKSHVVVAKVGDKVKTIRFGQQGVSGSPKKKGESASYRNRRESFKARHAKNIAKGKMSAAYWADRAKW